MKDKLWHDLKTDMERVEFLISGKAHETGIIAQSIVNDVASAFYYRHAHEGNKIIGCQSMTLIEQMRNVSTEMAELAKRLLDIDDPDHQKHGDELYGATMQVNGWAEYLEEANKC